MTSSARNSNYGDLPSIRFPVFRRIEISGYELFPGLDGNGIDHRFGKGVTVVAGVNGIGKTTLLNILFRLLVGPLNPEKATPFEIGAKSHLLVGWSTPFLFRSRVSDLAASATAYAEIAIGQHVIRVRRRLADLAITELWLDASELDPNEPEFERVVVDATNVSSRYDYDFLIRYLVFFLEQRVPLFWNERGQIETFRILLCESKLAEEFQDLQDKIQQLDSQYRNLRWHANKRENELNKKRRNLATAGQDSAKVLALREEYSALREKSNTLADDINTHADVRSELRTQLLLQKIDLEQQQRQYEGLQQNYLATIFPGEDETSKYVFSTLLAEHGCLVCGNRSERGKQRLTRLLQNRQCPVCESPPNEQERVIAGGDFDLSALTVKEVADKIMRLQRSIGELERQEAEGTKSILDLARERTEITKAMSRAEAGLTKLKARVSVSSEEIDALEKLVSVDREERKRISADLEGMYLQYEALIGQVTTRVQNVADQIRRLFEEYAKSFLAEKCTLGFSTYKDKLGQEKQFTYPCFEVYMTSATSPDRPTVRKSENEVSESQREFIDLAFRMALIAAVSPTDSPAMLVIETPEASLDSFFVDQAGKMLRQFGEGGGDRGNLVIVSSNLNRQNMVGALLGFTEAEKHWPSPEEVDSRLLNLLTLARENAAVRENRDHYEGILRESVQGRLI